jgi:hypothetical protein
LVGTNKEDFKCSCASSILKLIIVLLHGKWTEIATFLLIASGQCYLSLLDSRWALQKGSRNAGYKMASKQFLKRIGKPLGNSQIIQLPAG